MNKKIPYSIIIIIISISIVYAWNHYNDSMHKYKSDKLGPLIVPSISSSPSQSQITPLSPQEEKSFSFTPPDTNVTPLSLLEIEKAYKEHHINVESPSPISDGPVDLELLELEEQYRKENSNLDKNTIAMKVYINSPVSYELNLLEEQYRQGLTEFNSSQYSYSFPSFDSPVDPLLYTREENYRNKNSEENPLSKHRLHNEEP